MFDTPQLLEEYLGRVNTIHHHQEMYPSFMKTLNENQYHLIKADLQVQRGNVKIWNLPLINAGVYIAENGCKWRSLPEKFGHWYTIYTCAKRWAEHGVLERLCIGLQKGNFLFNIK